MAGMFETQSGPATKASKSAFQAQLNKVYGFYTGGFVAFVIVLAILEQMGLPRDWIGFIFLLATIGLYAGIGIMSRTTDASEYYVAGRRVPALYNGMATGADWMSAASFIGMAGTLYLTGYSGLAFIMGWTGGYCLVALFLAPYLRKFGQFTIPDFLGERYGGNFPRFLGIIAAILCSFTYVVAQIYGVGLITTRLTGVAFELGIFMGLGGILVCSFLGGMRAARGQTDRRPDPSSCLRLPAPEGHGERSRIAQGSERARGSQDFCRAGQDAGRQAQGCPGRSGRRQTGGRAEIG